MEYGIRSYGQLTCSSCGGLIGVFGGTWQEAENRAAEFKLKKHVCGKQPMNEMGRFQTLGRIADLMQAIRKNNPPMSFEEECQRYSALLKTYNLK